VPAFDLEKLGPFGFQDLAAALLLTMFGPGVKVMGRGRDGGRDLYTDEPITWTRGDGGALWQGRTVFQVKHKEQLAAEPRDNARWLWDAIRDELRTWIDDVEQRPSVPRQLVFVTNVPLSPVPHTGGRDWVESQIARQRRLIAEAEPTPTGDTKLLVRRQERLPRIEQIEIIDGSQIGALLAVHNGVRRAFPALMTPGDVFALVGEFTGAVPPPEVEDALREHARAQLTADQTVWLAEAGDPDEGKVRLHQCVVDLPVLVQPGTPAEERSSVALTVMARAQRMRRRSFSTLGKTRHLVITGAPGNGKTTMSKFLVEAFRATLLQGTQLSDEQDIIVRGISGALEEMGAAPPVHLRWPIRVDLAKYAEQGRFVDGTTLLKAMAETLSNQVNRGRITGAALGSWLQHFPWLVVLDGLDEVTDPETRRQLINRVEEFANEAEALNADLLIVVTTRPLGYNDEFSAELFERLELQYFSPEEALRYGERVTGARLRVDEERKLETLKRLRQAAADRTYEPLLRTPLQVLILSIIAESGPSLAADRFGLFNGYYQTIWRRESAKSSALNRLFDEYDPAIRALHNQMGFRLQAASEDASDADAVMPEVEFRDLVREVLLESGYEPSGKDAHRVDELFNAATRRLVLITPHNDGLAFDVRSLQELMAALHLLNAPPNETLRSIRDAAASPHWRNALLFVAGHIFAHGPDHFREALVQCVQTVDVKQAERLGSIFPVGGRLALDMIDDGMARNHPRWRRELFKAALHVLEQPDPEINSIAAALIRAAETSDDLRDALRTALSRALATPGVPQGNAEMLIDSIKRTAEQNHLSIATRGLVLTRPSREHPDPIDAGQAWDTFDLEVATAPLEGSDVELLAEIASEIRHRLAVLSDVPLPVARIARNRPVLAVLDTALRAVQHVDVPLISLLRKTLWPAVSRQPVAPQLRRTNHHN
jgi:hypothetical protein